MFRQVCLCGLAGMDAGMIPDQDEPPPQMPLHMLEGLDQVLTVHAASKLALVNLARPGQGNTCRPGASLVADPTHYRPLAFGRPGVGQGLQKRQAKLIEKDDFYPEPTRFFLSGASPVPARHVPVLRPAQRHEARALGGSNRTCVASDPGNKGDRLPPMCS